MNSMLAVLLYARLGRWGPRPTTSCGSHCHLYARLGRWGPRPTTSCGSHYKIATARVQPAEAPRIFTGKHAIVKPWAGSVSRLCGFSRRSEEHTSELHHSL